MRIRGLLRFLRKYMSNEAWNSADMNAHWIHDVIRRDPPSSTWLFIPSSGFWWWPFLSYSYSNLHFSLLWIGRKRSEWNGKKRWWEIPPDVLMGSLDRWLPYFFAVKYGIGSTLAAELLCLFIYGSCASAHQSHSIHQSTCGSSAICSEGRIRANDSYSTYSPSIEAEQVENGCPSFWGFYFDPNPTTHIYIYIRN